MAAIDLVNLTNSSDNTEGTGVFDLLIQAVERQIEGQYGSGRITGPDYATVYLGSMQSVLSESVKFILTEQQADKQADLVTEQIASEVKKNEAGGLIDLEKQKLQESIDLIIAQTASQYEGVQASRQDTIRKNLLNSKQVIKIDKDTELVISQNSELLLNGPVDRTLKTEQTTATTSGALDKTNETNAQVALINAQELKTQSETLHDRYGAIAKLDKELGYDITFALDGSISVIAAGTGGLVDENITKAQEEIDLLQSRDLETIAATTRQDAESAEKVKLLEAQTIGFRADSKQKMLKLMMDGVAVETTTGGIVLPTSLTNTANITEVANDILDDWGSLVTI